MRAIKILVLILVCSACTKKAEAPAPVEKVNDHAVRLNTKEDIKTLDIAEGKYPVTVEFDGRIGVPDKDIVSVSSRISGRLDALNVSVGDRVRAGQSLGTMWSPDLATAAQEYAIAKKEGGELLQLTLQKLRSLGISPGEARPGISSCGLHSSVDGVVLEKKVSAGSAINPGDVIMTIGKSGTLQFIGDLAPSDAIKVKPGMDVAFDDAPTLHAVVDNVSPISDPSTHMVRVRCRFTTKLPDDLPQESFLKSRIHMNEIEGLVVPSEAIVFADGGDTIFIRDDSVAAKNVYNRTKINVKSRGSKDSEIEIPGTQAKAFHVITQGALLVNDALEDTGSD